MGIQVKCTVGDEKASFGSKHDALAEGWVFAQVENEETLKYFVLCPEHSELDWVKKALAGKKAKS